MIKITKQSLANLVLVSTLFSYTPAVLGAITISTPTVTAVSYPTSVYGDITIAPTGNLVGTGVTSTILVNTPNATITLDPNNINPIALQHISSTALQIESPLAKVIVGENTNITSAFYAVVFAGGGNGSTLENNGTIIGDTDSGSVYVSGTAGSIVNSETGFISNIIVSGGGDVTNGVVNSGTLGNIQAIGGGTISGGFTNNGTITGVGIAPIAFGFTPTPILFTNNEPGTVSGTVVIGGSNVPFASILQMNGGSLDSVSVTASGVARTLNVAGGSISSLFINGTTQDVINYSGGTIGSIQGDYPDANQTLNILGPVSVGTITNLANVIVHNGVNFTTSASITGSQNVTVNSGGALTNNNSISSENVTVDSGGQLNNNGTITTTSLNVSGLLDNNSTLNTIATIVHPGGTFLADTLGTATANNFTTNGSLVLKLPNPNSNANLTTGAYAQGLAGNVDLLEVDIKNTANYGNIEVTGPGVTFVGGRFLKPNLVGGELINNLDTFTIIDHTGGGTTGGQFIILQPPSATISFVQLDTLSDVILQAIRTPFVDIAGDNPITIPPSISIDTILNSGMPLSPEFQALIVALDSLQEPDLQTALITVVPQFDGGLVNLSRLFQENIFRGLGRYLDEHRPLAALIPGYVAGDVGMGRWSGLEYSRGTWVQAFGVRSLQKDNYLSLGYDTEGIGATFGYDQYCSDRLVLGGALTYANGDIFSNDPGENTQSVKSFQLTAYSTYDYKGPGYLDTMIAVAFNNYDSTRNIIAGPFVATSSAEFTAWNYGVNLESGYRLSYGKYRIIPVVRALYSRLQIDNYTETGAGGVSLSVTNEPVEQGVTAIGIKFNSTNYYQEAAYVPEFRFNILYDWINEGQTTSSSFLEAPPPFITDAFVPKACTFNLGLSLTALASESTVFVLNYDMDLQRDYVAHNVSMKFRYEW